MFVISEEAMEVVAVEDTAYSGKIYGD